MGDQPTPAAPAGPPRVVVGVDESNEATAALRWAYREALLRDVELWLVHAYSLPAVVTWHTGPVYVGDRGHHQAEAESLLLRLQHESIGAGDGVRVRRVAQLDLARDLLVDQSVGADLLVIGQHRHHHLHESLSGTASQVVQRARCPVVVVHPGDTAGPEGEDRPVAAGRTAVPD